MKLSKDDIEEFATTEISNEQKNLVMSEESRHAQMMLQFVYREYAKGDYLLTIIKTLLKAKTHFRMFKPEEKIDVCLEMLLDKLEKNIEHLFCSKWLCISAFDIKKSRFVPYITNILTLLIRKRCFAH